METCRNAVAVLAFIACSASPTLLCQSGGRLPDREARQLLGPVKAVHSVVMLRRSPNSLAEIQSVSDETYSPDGWLLDTQSFDREGKPLSHWSFSRDGARLLQQEITTYVGPKPSRTVTKFGRRSRDRDRNIRPGRRGLLLSRKVMQRTPDGVHTIEYDSEGKVVSDKLRRITDGEVIREVEERQTPTGLVTHTTATLHDGSWERTTVRDQNGTRSVDVSPGGQTTAVATDTAGHTVTVIHDGLLNGSGERVVQQFDPLGRLTSASVYGGESLRSKQTVTYSNDEHGNWVKMVNQQQLANGEPQAVTTTVRTISYY